MWDAIVFDLDGLLIDTEAACFDAANAIVHTRTGAQLQASDFARFVGRPVHELCGGMRERYGLAESVDELLAERHRRLLTAYEHPRLMPGALDLVTAADRAGLALAIASSAPGILVETAAAALPFNAHLKAVVSADHALVTAPKPAPDIYLAACTLLGIAPAAALAVEDSPSGALAAVLAGLQTITVPNMWTADAAFPEQAERVTSLADIIPRITMRRARGSRGVPY
jgi:putative hydrolase of the HAD superfamily